MGNLLDKLGEGGWNVAVREKCEGLILRDQQTPFTLIPNSPCTWEADPFLFEHEGRLYVFAEMLDYRTHRGHIGYASLENGRWSKWKCAIREPFHMSYPNIFRLGDTICMVPETSADSSLRLYRAVSFPDTWVLEKVLAENVRWVDTTFWTENGRHYAVTRDEDRQQDLLLELNGQLDILRITPICEADPDRSRPGGNFFVGHDTILRVTQDCSSHYGGGLVFSAFDSDTLTARGMGPALLQLGPEQLRFSQHKKWTGLHTYNTSEHYEVVDVERQHFHVVGLFTRILAKLRRR